MLRPITKIVCFTLVLVSLVACNKPNPLNNKNAMEDLLYVLNGESEVNWPGVCEMYYINPASLRYKKHEVLCSGKSEQIYNKYKNHSALKGATIPQFRDAAL